MDTARKRFADACVERLGAMSVASRAQPLDTVTIDKIQEILRDVDPDGRFVQESRLMMACQRLSKEDVDVLITVATYLGARDKTKA